MGIDMQRLSTVHHAKGRDQTNKAKTMIAMQMRDENRIQTRRLHPQLAHCDLHTLATIDKKGLVAQLNNLPRRRVLKGRHSTTRAEYGELVVHCFWEFKTFKEFNDSKDSKIQRIQKFKQFKNSKNSKI